MIGGAMSEDRPAVHEFRKPAQNLVRDDMLSAMAAGAVSTRELIGMGESRGLFAGETTGVIGTLSKKGVIERYALGWWQLPRQREAADEVRPESVGDVEVIGAETTRVGEVINHRGMSYYRQPNAPDRAPIVRHTDLTTGEKDVLDEVVAHNAYVHLEVMADNHWWMIITAGGTSVHVNLYTRRAKITGTAELDD
jgi:hypothetical protein